MYDLVVRGGTVHDGAGSAPFAADIAIGGGRILAVGDVREKGAEEIDATGRIVTPGFVDVHTHYDGQAMWENRLAPSSNHGVTTVVMGNCGVGFAPCRPHQRAMLIELMEGVEDIPEVVMTEGLPWNWETFPEYLDALAARRLDIDVAAQLPHSALRVYVMGARGARKEAPTSDDLARMRALTAEAIGVGALGVTTSRNLLHRTRAGAVAPSLHSDEDEFMALADGLKDADAGVFQMIAEITGDQDNEFDLMRRIAERSGRPLSFSLLQMATGDAGSWRRSLDGLTRAANDGVDIRAQVFPRPVGVLFGLDLSFHPFALHPSFRALVDRPLAEKVAAMRDPGFRAALLAETPEDTNPVSLKLVDLYPHAYPLGDPPVYDPAPENRIEAIAAREGRAAIEVAYDALLAQEGRAVLYLPGANYRDGTLAAARTMFEHPRTILGLGDGGAHYGMICDASWPTYMLQKWVRDEKDGEGVDLAWAVAEMTSRPADALGLADRGRIAAGYKADLSIIDLNALTLHAPTVVYDLPAGGKRLAQKSDGFDATIVSGTITYRGGEPTGALPGRLVRGRQAVPLMPVRSRR